MRSAERRIVFRLFEQRLCARQFGSLGRILPRLLGNRSLCGIIGGDVEGIGELHRVIDAARSIGHRRRRDGLDLKDITAALAVRQGGQDDDGLQGQRGRGPEEQIIALGHGRQMHRVGLGHRIHRLLVGEADNQRGANLGGEMHHLARIVGDIAHPAVQFAMLRHLVGDRGAS